MYSPILKQVKIPKSSINFAEYILQINNHKSKTVNTNHYKISLSEPLSVHIL